MVVAGRTQQLIKTSKNVTLSKKFSLSTHSSSFGYVNYLKNPKDISGTTKNDPLVRLCCNCRRFHSTDYYHSSREPRSTFTKLTPQEVLLINATLASSLDLSGPLYQFQQALLSENPTEAFNSLINRTLSRENVQLLLKDVLPIATEDLPNKLANEDLLNNIVQNYVENTNSGLLQLQRSGINNVQSTLDVLNSGIGGAVLQFRNNSVGINVDALGDVFLAFAKGYIRENFSNDIFLQIVVTETLRQQIQIASSELKPVLANATIPSEVVSEITSLIGSNRSKRDLGNIILQLIRIHIGVFLRPVQQYVNTVLNNAISTILSFYTSVKPNNIIVGVVANFTNAIILRAAEVVVTIRYNINGIFNNIVNGTSASVSRRRRDIDLELQNYYDFAQTSLVPRKRVARSVDLQGIIDAIGGLLSGSTDSLNALLKNIFVSILSSQYEAIGKLVTTPLRVLFQWIVDIVIPCTTCISII